MTKINFNTGGYFNTGGNFNTGGIATYRSGRVYIGGGVKATLANFPSCKHSYDFKNIVLKKYASSKSKGVSRQTIYFEYSPIFNTIKSILDDTSKTSIEKQMDIEKFLMKTWVDEVKQKKEIISDNKVISESFKLINEYINEYIKILKQAISLLDSTKGSRKDITDYNILFQLKVEDIAATVLNQVIPILTNPEGVNYSSFILKLGDLIYHLWIVELYEKNKKLIKKQKQECSDIHNGLQDLSENKERLINDIQCKKFSDFIKEHELSISAKGKIGEFLIFHFVRLGDFLEKKLVPIEGTKHVEYKLFPNTDMQKKMDKTFNIIGFKLPMVCKPGIWSEGEYGGYLLNKDNYNNDLIHKSYIAGDTKTIDNSIYNQVNFMNNIGYKINKEVLDFIIDHGVENNLILKSLHENTSNLHKLSKEEQADVIAHNSVYYQERNILGMAMLFKDMDCIYFPLFYDWRGRIYNDVSYLNYQSIPLAKALIIFAEGNEISKEDIDLWRQCIKSDTVESKKDKFFYWLCVYGANCFGSGCFKLGSKYPLYRKKAGIDKLSFNERVAWITAHHKYIISMNKDFWIKADDPILFLAFCFEYRNIYKRLTNKTHIPIQIDASCNGLQHLSVMSSNSNLARLVNLMPSDYSSSPKDLYSIVLNEINKKISLLVKENPMYIMLSKLKLDRKTVKRSIMTIPYNVTEHGIINHLKEFLKEHKVDNNILYKPIDVKHGVDYISGKDLYKLACIIRSTLFEMHPDLNNLICYFNKMVDVFNKLNIPIIWSTPSGLKIKQKYTITKSAQIRSGYYKGASFNILIPTNVISKKLQKNGFMPNLIHSMDASTITVLIKRLTEIGFKNIYTIHDCFATTACNIPFLHELVRESFISLYADNNFVCSLHKLFIEYINSNYDIKHVYTIDGVEKCEIFKKGSNNLLDKIIYDKFIIIDCNSFEDNVNNIVLPDIPKLGDLTNLRENLRKAIYKLN